ncbi:MAG: hypothetical protein PVG07_16105, partial [Acidobacteriota bacterium]
MRQTDRPILVFLFVLALATTLAAGWACHPQPGDSYDDEPMAETEEVEAPEEATAEQMDASVATARLQTADGADLGTVT